MKAICLESIVPGSIAQRDHFSEKGELLIAEGAVISDRHLEALRRRNIQELFVQGSMQEDPGDDIAQTLADAAELDLELQASDHGKPADPTLLPGREGLEHLLRSEKALNLDSRIEAKQESDGPSGIALNRLANLSARSHRSSQYKSAITISYRDALYQTKNILMRLADGGSVRGSDIRSIVEQFIEIFISDHNILLSISGTPHQGDDYLFNHSLNVCLLSINIAASYGYNKDQVTEIGVGALVHDVGMLLIPRRIRCSEGKLSEDDWYEVQKHPILSLHLLEKVIGLPNSSPFIAYQIHERVNARGYPKRRSDRLIHRHAKLVQVADVYEAMTMMRPHREPLLPYKAMENLLKMAKCGLASEECVKAFLEYASLFPVGSLVELSDKRIARVIHANKNRFTRPVISVITDLSGNLLPEDQTVMIDLRESPLRVSRPLPAEVVPGIDLLYGF